MRYLARKLGYAGGQSELDQAVTDQYADIVTDLLNDMVNVHFETERSRKAVLDKKMQTETMPKFLQIFEKRLTENNGFLAGNSLSYADVSIIQKLFHLKSLLIQPTGILNNWVCLFSCTCFQLWSGLTRRGEKLFSKTSHI